MSHDDTTEHLVGGLPPYYPSSAESSNYDLLSPIGDELDNNEDDIEEVDRSLTIQTVGRVDYNVSNGETVTIPEGETWVFRDVTVNGTLVIDGELIAKSVDQSNGTVTNNGTLDTGTGYRDEIVDRLQALAQPIDLPPEESEAVEHYRARILAEFSLTTSRGTIEDLIVTAAEILDVDESSIGFSEPSGGENGTAEISLPTAALDQYELDDQDLVSVLDRLIPAGYRLTGFRGGTFTYITPADYDVDNHDASLGYDGLDGNGDPNGNGGTYAGLI